MRIRERRTALSYSRIDAITVDGHPCELRLYYG
jgi:hypothetical protein